MNSRALVEYVGRQVRISFVDGEESIVRLVQVDIADHYDIIYDVLEILEPGASQPRLPADAFYRAHLSEIADWNPV